MSNIITARDPYIIAAEINTIKRQVQETVIAGSLRIGEKLQEAKSLVPQGEWGKWLEENVEYSQSTAENLMKLYREYGTNQQSLFDTWTSSQTFGKLSYTQHLALLALPFAERQEFAENNNVADMSNRQLQQAIREREEAEALLRDANQSILNMQQQLAAAKSGEGAWQEQIDRLTSERDTAETNEENMRKEIDKLTAEKHLAETSEKNATKKVEVLENQLKEARKKEKTAREELKKAQENPDIPESVMEQLRREAEADALSKAAGDLQKQLESANAALAAEQERARAIEEKLDAAQRKNDPEMVECNVVAQKLRADFNSLLGWVKKISVGDREKGEKMLKFLRLLVKAWAEALGMEVKM